MTKAELLAAIAAAPDTTNVYVDINETGLLRSVQSVVSDDESIVLYIVVEPSEEDDDVG